MGRFFPAVRLCRASLARASRPRYAAADNAASLAFLAHRPAILSTSRTACYAPKTDLNLIQCTTAIIVPNTIGTGIDWDAVYASPLEPAPSTLRRDGARPDERLSLLRCFGVRRFISALQLSWCGQGA